MIFKENALSKALENAFNVGYEIIPNGERMTICTEKWAIDANRWDLPLKVNLKLIEHAGFIPNTPIKVDKGGETHSSFLMKQRTFIWKGQAPEVAVSGRRRRSCRLYTRSTGSYILPRTAAYALLIRMFSAYLMGLLLIRRC